MLQRKTGALYLPESATCTLYLNRRVRHIFVQQEETQSENCRKKYLRYEASVAVFTVKICWLINSYYSILRRLGQVVAGESQGVAGGLGSWCQGLGFNEIADWV
jgi:hypothetical protein